LAETADPASITFTPYWNRNDDLINNNPAQGEESVDWRDAQDIRFYYFTAPEQELDLLATNHSFRFSFGGICPPGGSIEFQDLTIHMKPFPGPSRYYIGVGDWPYYFRLRAAPADALAAYRESDPAQTTGSYGNFSQQTVTFVTESAVARGFGTEITPLTYDWRAEHQLNFDSEIDYSAISDPCLQELLQNPGANIYNGILYLCDFDQLIEGVPLHEAIKGSLPAGTGDPRETINIVVNSYSYAPSGQSCNLTLIESFTVKVPTLQSITPRAVLTQQNVYLIEPPENLELLAIAFLPPEAIINQE
jgi:hypothetical protein